MGKELRTIHNEDGTTTVFIIDEEEKKEAMIEWLASILAQFCHLYGDTTSHADPEISKLIQGKPSTDEIIEFIESHIDDYFDYVPESFVQSQYSIRRYDI